MTLSSRILFPFTKHVQCPHKYGCVEYTIRRAFKSMTLLVFAHSASRMILDVNLYSVLSDLIKDNVPFDWSETKLNFACFGA